MPEIILILDNLRSTYNVGSLARTCDGLGIGTIYTLGITPHMRQPNDERLPHVITKAEKAISKTALGAETLLKTHYETFKSLLPYIGDYKIASIEQSNVSVTLDSYQPEGKIALVLGNEIDGVQPEILKRSDAILELSLIHI